MNKARKKGVLDFVIAVIVALLLLGCIGGLFMWLAREEGLTVYVQHNDNRYTIKSVNTSLGILDSGEHVFYVGSFPNETVDYSVEISPNLNTDFDFSVNDRLLKWSRVNCSDYFGISIQPDRFTITVTHFMSMTHCLRSIYDSDIEYLTDISDGSELFLLTVKTSYGVIVCPFGLPVISDYDGIVISKDNVIF